MNELVQIQTPGILWLLGSIGGVIEIIIFIVGLLVIPINNLNLELKLIKLLFYAKTSDDLLFDQKRAGACCVEPNPVSKNGKKKKEVRFQIDEEDANQIHV